METAELKPNLEALRRGKVAIKFAISLFSFFEATEDVDSPINHTDSLAVS